MVTASYLLDRPPPPTPIKRFVDQRALPAAIDAAGSLETLVEQAAQRVIRQPFAALAAALLGGFVLARLLRAMTR